MTTIAVAGATGTVGHHVVAALEADGHQVVPLSRSDGVDVRTGAGLADALHGVEAVVDVLSTPSRSTTGARAFFGTTTSSLLAAEKAQGVGHHVVLSIVGIDGAPTGHYAGKLRQEELVRGGPVPWTILRATQFHEFAGQLLDGLALGPLSPMPVARLRPVAAHDVAAVLARLAAGRPRHATLSVRGPREEPLVSMARRAARSRGRRRVIVPLYLPGRLGRMMRSGALCGDSSAEQTRTTFADWLSGQHRPTRNGESA